MNFLVTGGAGFIGSNVVHHLLAETAHSVLVIDNLTYAGNRDSLKDFEENERFQFQCLDICDAPAIAEAVNRFHPTKILHLAAESHVDRSIDGPGEFIQTNIVGTYRLLEVAREYFKSLPAQENFRFIHVSTDEVYGELTETDAAFKETTPYAPRSPYSASKASSDHLARAWFATYGLPVIVTNCSNNYGPFQFPEKLVPVVILKALRGEPIPVYGQGENVRDWLYVEDHARALAVIAGLGLPGETYNIGGNNERRNIELVKTLCRLLDEFRPKVDGQRYEQQITFVEDRPGHDQRYAIDATKISRELGWAPREDFESGFRKTVRWYLEHEPWWQNILSGEYRLQRLGVRTD